MSLVTSRSFTDFAVFGGRSAVAKVAALRHSLFSQPLGSRGIAATHSQLTGHRSPP